MKLSTKQWLEYAQKDLLNCTKICDDVELTNIVAFHSQQAVEKSFKALIIECDIIIPRIHSVVRLYNLIEVHLIKPIEIKELLALDSVYTNSRYPSEIGMLETGVPNLDESNLLYQSAKNIYILVMDSLTKLEFRKKS